MAVYIIVRHVQQAAATACCSWLALGNVAVTGGLRNG